MTKTLRHTATSALTACLALSLAGCGEGREYAVPKEACGVPIEEKALNPFLVDGEKLTVVGDSVIKPEGKTWGRCQIRVDGALIVAFQVDKVDKLYDPMDKSEEFRFRNREKMTNLPFDGLGALGDSNSMVSTDCAGPATDHLITYVSVDGDAGGAVAERRRNIEAFTIDLVPKVKKELGCSA
ncbi:hypothetical protein ACLB9X_21405 [Streptomyces sp. 5K101]|uniref:hypothetical protein n=1 Tax=Streptomyces sp. 5K101 TaxID=3390037 RepID=UPI003974C8C8